MTINEAMQFVSQVKGRISKLQDLRSQLSTETRWMTEKEKVVTPQYDVKKLDAYIVRMENWIWKIEARIKTVNASTDIGLIDGKTIPVDELLSPIE